MANLLSWLSDAVHNVENGIGGFVNGAVHTGQDAVNNVAHAVAPQQQQQQQRRQAPPQARQQVQGFRPSIPTTQSFNAATASRNSVINQTKPQQGGGFDPVGFIANNLVKPVMNAAGDVGNAYAADANYFAGELNGSHAKQQAQVQDNIRQAYLNAAKSLTAPSQYVAAPGTPNAQSLMRQAQGNISIANTAAQQQQNQVNDVVNSATKLPAADLTILSTLAAPGMSKIAEPIAGALSPYIRTPIANAIGGAISQLPVGAAIGGGGTLASGDFNPQHILNNTLQGAGSAALLGGAVPIAAPIVGKAGQAAVKVATNPDVLNALEKSSQFTQDHLLPGASLKPINGQQPLLPKDQTPSPKEPAGSQKTAQPNPDPTAVPLSSPAPLQEPVSTASIPNEALAQLKAPTPTQSPQSAKIPKNQSRTEQGSNVSSTPNSTPSTPDTQVNVNDYVNQQHTAQEQARKAGETTKFQELKNGISTKLIDNLSPIENTLKQAIKDGAKVSQKNHITPQLDRALRSDTIAGQYLHDNGLSKIIQNVPSTKEFDQYLIAKHAADLEKNGVKTGRNLAADQQLIKQLGPTYEAHAQAVNKYNNGLLDKAVDYGLVNKDVATGLKQKYPNYVPANRIFGEGEKNTHVGKGGVASKSTQTVVQKIKGSDRQIESPLASIANKTADVINQGERNKAAQMLASYKSLPGNPFNLRELKPSEMVGAKSTIAYLDNGKVRRFETTPEIEAAAKSLNKQQMNILGKIASVPTRILRLGATGLNPAFALANVAKDVVSAAINTEHSLKASPLNLPVLGKATAAALNHGSKSYAELVREGAGGTSFDIARDAPRQTVQKIRSEKNIRSKITYTVTHPSQLFRAVEDTIGRSEEFNRAIQYYGNKKAALDNGMSEYESRIYGANAARHNSVNFARHGDWGQVLNSVVPYLNAGAQGSRTFLRNIKERPVRTLTKVAVLSTIPVLTTTAWNLSDPKRKAAYNDISDYEKQGNIIIVPPNPVKDPKTGRWNVIKIPVSQEVANLNNIARSAFESAQGNGKLDPAQVIGDLIGTTTSLNAGSPRQIANQVTPQALKPLIENLTNQNLFTGNKIVPDSQQNLPAPDQYGQGTSGTAKILGKTFNGSPRQIDNFVKTTFGGTGQIGVNALDKLLAATGAIPANEVQGKSVGSSIESRFLGAASKSTADANQTQFEKLRSQLINSDAYKNASQQDKAKQLNKLQRDVNAVGYNAADTANPGSGYTPPKLTKNQVKLSNGNFNPATYTTPAKQTGPTSDLYKSNDAEYKQLQAAYDQKVKDGSYTQAQQIKAETALNKAKVGADFSKQTRDFYGLSKAQLANLVTTDPNGKAILDQVLKYGDALVDSGIASYNKFRNNKTGAVSLANSKGGRKASGGRRVSRGRKSSGVAGFALASSARSKAYKIKTPKITKAPSLKSKGAKPFKAPSIKQLANAPFKTPNVPVKKHSQVA